MQIPLPLLAEIQKHSRQVPSPAVDFLIHEIQMRYGNSVRAVLFYGSCLRTGLHFDGLLDFYVLVDNYHDMGQNPVKAALNKLLPPNVFYFEGVLEGQVVRAKYAVLTIADLQNGTSTRWFHSYLWGRFCQPTAMVYASSDKIADEVNRALAQAVITFIYRVLPCLPVEFSTRDLWQTGLGLSYHSELRTEQSDQPIRLFDAAPGYFEAVTQKAVAAIPYPLKCINSPNGNNYHADISNRVRRTSRFTWSLRKLQGKVLSVLRLVKGMTTFQGGVEYILWKIKRHSGVTVTVSPRLKRYPLLAMCIASWRIYRKGGFR